ncbi:MAG: hypothetical protein ACLPTZ_15895 [Beijerinckiaceae bacterium]
MLLHLDLMGERLDTRVLEGAKAPTDRAREIDGRSMSFVLW